MLVCELAASLKLRGKTILDALDALYATYGQYLSKVISLEMQGADAMEKSAKLMADFRSEAPKAIGGANVTVVRDYQSGVEKNIVTGEENIIALPSSNVLEYILGEQGSVIIRPSGTEPKVKFYYTAIAASKDEAQKLLDKMIAQMSI
jgi:phosphoglucomutase